MAATDTRSLPCFYAMFEERTCAKEKWLPSTVKQTVLQFLFWRENNTSSVLSDELALADPGGGGKRAKI